MRDIIIMLGDFSFFGEVFHWMQIKISSGSCVFRGRELRFGADSWEKTIFDEIQVFLLVRGGLRRKILVESCILNFESAFLATNDIFSLKMTRIDNFFE